MTNGTLLSLVVLISTMSIIVICVYTTIVTHESNIILKDNFDVLLSNQQKLLSTTYLATSSNNLLIENQKQFIPAIPTIHHTLANIERMINQTQPILIKFGQIEFHNISSISNHR